MIPSSASPCRRRQASGRPRLSTRAFRSMPDSGAYGVAWPPPALLSKGPMTQPSVNRPSSRTVARASLIRLARRCRLACRNRAWSRTSGLPRRAMASRARSTRGVWSNSRLKFHSRYSRASAQSPAAASRSAAAAIRSIMVAAPGQRSSAGAGRAAGRAAARGRGDGPRFLLDGAAVAGNTKQDSRTKTAADRHLCPTDARIAINALIAGNAARCHQSGPL